MDLGIIGGGPAGTMAAIEAARTGLGVVIWDRGIFPRDRVCGEFLSPESLPLLKEVISGTISRAAAIRRAEYYSKKARCHSIPLPAAGAGLSRLALDEALWRAAANAGAVCRQAEEVVRVNRVQVPEGGGKRGWEVTSTAANSTRVRQLLVASGRWWKVDGLPSPVLSSPILRNRRRHWIGAKAHFAGMGAHDAVEMYFFQGGYCGIAPIEDGIYNACCLVRRGLVRLYSGRHMMDFASWVSKVSGHPALAARLRSGVQVSETITTAPACPARRTAELAGALAAGDAAGFLDPFTGEGISMALYSGKLAAREFARGLRHKSSQEIIGRYRLQLGRSVRRSYACAALLRTLVDAPSGLQDWVAATMPSLLSRRLLSETRWQPGTVN